MRQRSPKHYYGYYSRGTNWNGTYATHKPKRPWIVFTLLVLALYVVYTFLRPVAYAAQLLVPQPDIGTTNAAWPRTGEAAIGIEGQGLVAASSDNKVAIASITKLVTALAVLDKKPLRENEPGQLYYFDNEDIDTYQWVVSEGGAAVPIKAGQGMTERQALEAMILPSANNIAITLSKWVFGSEAQYVRYANEMLEKHGFAHTQISGASGLELNTTSTPGELVRVVELVLKSPVLSTIVDKPGITIPGLPAIRNINHISGVNNAVHAMKVGLNDAAGSCLVFWVDPSVNGGPNIKIYGVIMGQHNFNDVRTYVNNFVDHTIPANFSYIKIAKAGQPVSSYTDQAGELITTSAKTDIMIPHWQGQPIAVHTSKAKATDLQVTTGTTTKTFALDADKQPSFAIMWRLLHPF